MIDTEQFTATSNDGSDGSATGTGYSGTVNGLVLAVHIDPGSQPGTVDVTLKATQPELTILTASNISAAGWYYPRVQAQDNAGAGVTFDGTNEIYEPVPVDGQLSATIAQGDVGETVTVTVKVRK